MGEGPCPKLRKYQRPTPLDRPLIARPLLEWMRTCAKRLALHTELEPKQWNTKTTKYIRQTYIRHIRTYIHTYIHTCKRQTHTHTYTYIHTYKRQRTKDKPTYIHTCFYTCEGFGVIKQVGRFTLAASLSVCLYVCTYLCMYVLDACLMCVYLLCMLVCMSYRCMYIYIYIYTHIYTIGCDVVWKYLSVHMYTQQYVDICLYIHMCIYTHYTHFHIFSRASAWSEG